MSAVAVLSEAQLAALLREAAREGAKEALAAHAAKPEDEWLDRHGAAELLNVHVDTVRRLPGLPVHHVGRKLRYSRAELVMWMRSGYRAA